MGVAITIMGTAKVTDDTTGEPISDPKKVRKLARLRHTEAGDLISDYFDADLTQLGIIGGDLRLLSDSSGRGVLIVSTFKAPRVLTKTELNRLVEETTGQWSDGLGEGCFDLPARELGVTIDLLQTARPKVVQVEELKPAKVKKPPSAKTLRIEELVRAEETGNLDKVNELLAAGADPNIVSTAAGTKSALSWAVLAHAPPLVEALVAASADPNLRDADTDMRSEPTGMTPLMHVMDPAIARLLLNAGADPSMRNGYEGTPTAAEYLRSVYGHYEECREAADDRL